MEFFTHKEILNRVILIGITILLSMLIFIFLLELTQNIIKWAAGPSTVPFLLMILPIIGGELVFVILVPHLYKKYQETFILPPKFSLITGIQGYLVVLVLLFQILSATWLLDLRFDTAIIWTGRWKVTVAIGSVIIGTAGFAFRPKLLQQSREKLTN
jgi:hypothetical protein